MFFYNCKDKDMQNLPNLFQKPPFGGLIRYLYLMLSAGAKRAWFCCSK